MVYSSSDRGSGSPPSRNSTDGFTSDSETGEPVRRIRQRPETPSVISEDEHTPIHPDVGGYLAVMTGMNLYYAPARDGGVSDNASLASSSSAERAPAEEWTEPTHIPVDPVTQAYIRDMTGVTLLFSSEQARDLRRDSSDSVTSSDGAAVAGYDPRYSSPSSPSTTPGLESDRSSFMPSSRSQSAVQSDIRDNVIVEDENNPLSVDVRLDLAAEHGFESPASFRSSPAGEGNSSGYDSEDDWSTPSSPVHDVSDPRHPRNDHHSGAFPADREGRAGQDRGSSDGESILESIEYDSDQSSESSESSRDSYAGSAEIDARTQRYLHRMTGLRPQEIQDLWEDGTPPLVELPDGRDGSSAGSDDGPGRAPTPAGSARIDPLTRRFLHQMTGRAPQFVSLGRERATPTRQRQESTASADSAPARPGPTVRTNENGKRERSPSDDVQPANTKRLRTLRGSPEASLRPDANDAPSRARGSAGTVTSPCDSSGRERSRSAGRG